MSRFKLYYRLNSGCEWQTAYPEGLDIKDAKTALLLAVMTIYRMSGKTVDIIEKPGETTKDQAYWNQYPYGEC